MVELNSAIAKHFLRVNNPEVLQRFINNLDELYHQELKLKAYYVEQCAKLQNENDALREALEEYKLAQ